MIGLGKTVIGDQRADPGEGHHGVSGSHAELPAVGQYDHLIGSLQQKLGFPHDEGMGFLHSYGRDRLGAKEELGGIEFGRAGLGCEHNARLAVKFAPRQGQVAGAVLPQRGGKRHGVGVDPDVAVRQQQRAALQIAIENPQASVTFLDYSCSGASIADGILGPQTYVERVASNERSAQLAAPMIAGGEKESQLYRLMREICREAPKMKDGVPTCPGNDFRRSLDFIFLSVGGNDIGFSDPLGVFGSPGST